MSKALGTRSDKRFGCPFRFPRANLKNIGCVQCKRQFYLKEFRPLQGTVPLMLQCGHLICDSCLRNASNNKLCPMCDIKAEDVSGKKSQLPINIYALGLLVINYNRPVDQTDDSEISFQQPLTMKSRQNSSQGRCSECGTYASFRCIQCTVLFCRACYQKIHGRALQNHTKVPLMEQNINDPLQLKTTCSKTCRNPLTFYCNTCAIAICRQCMLVVHVNHKFDNLGTKNDEQWGAFEAAREDIRQTLTRIEQLQKKIRSMTVQPESEDNKRDEARITEHFVQLHGILQNTEEKLLSQVREQRRYFGKNLDELQRQLKVNYDQLQTVYEITSSAWDNKDGVDIVEAIRSLEQLANIPCYLLEDPVPPNQKIQFDVDRTIFARLEEHCRITVPPVHGYSLLPKNLLPANYKIEPLPQDPLVPRSLGPANFQRKSNDTSTTELDLNTDEMEILPVGASAHVIPIHIVDPHLFFVQRKSMLGKMQEMERGLAMVANTSSAIPSEIMPKTLYLVKIDEEKGWCRGLVKNIKADKQRCDIFFVDYGTTEANVRISDLRIIPLAYTTRPPMALQCALMDVVPIDGIWQKKAIDRFTRMVKDAEDLKITVSNITGNCYYVKLSAINGTQHSDVTGALVHLKYANTLSPHQMVRMNRRSLGTYYPDHLRMDKYEEVEVLHIESPTSIFIQRVNASNVQAKKELLREMTEEYEQNPSIGYIDGPEKGLPCAALGIDGYWHRAIICEVISEDTLKVFFVDLGCTLEYNNIFIKKLREKYMKTRTMAIKVLLTNIVPLSDEDDKWSVDAHDYVFNCITQSYGRLKLIALEKFDDSYSVNIYFCGNQNLASYLVKRKLAKYRVPGKPNKFANKKLNKKQRKQDIMEFLTYDMEFDERKNSNTQKEDEDEFKVRVLIHEIVSPDCIYVAIAKYADLNADLTTNLQAFYNTYHTNSREDWTKDTTCVVYSAKDKSFFRAKILDVKSPEEVTVFFYDIGIKDTVSTKDIQALHSKFSQVAAYVFKIKLAGILPCGGSDIWPTHSIEKLREIISENEHCKFSISKTENTDDSTIPVELWIKQAKMDGPLAPTRTEINSINRMLIDEGVALPIKDYAMKRDKIVADEFKKQIKKRSRALRRVEERVRWYRNDVNLDDCVEVDVNESIASIFSLSMDATSEDEDSCSEGSVQGVASQSKLSSWIPAQPISADRFIALPTYIDYESIVYLHSIEENAHIIALIAKQLQERFKDSKIKKCDVEWNPNDLCIAPYHADSKWYRAKVVKNVANDQVEVQFVDYGNVEEMDIGKLRKDIMFGDIPIQCTKCKVHGLIPNNDTGIFKEKDLDIIHGALIGEQCEVAVLKREEDFLLVSITLLPNINREQKYDLIKHLVETYNLELKPEFDDEVNSNTCSISDISNSSNAVLEKSIDVLEICQKSIETGSIKLNNAIAADKTILDQYANMLETDDGKQTDIDALLWSNAEKHITTSTPHSPLSIENLATYNSIVIPEDITEIEVKITAFLSVTEIYAQLQENVHCQKLNGYYTSYQRITEDLQKDACNQPLIKSFVSNIACCTQFTDDKQWYRCLIQDVTQHPKKRKYVTVQFHYVDFGNEEIRKIHVKKHNVRCMKSEWLEVPTMIVKCQLWSVKMNSDLDAERNKLMRQMKNMDNKVLTVTIKEKVDDVFYIDYFKKKESGVVIYDPLKDEGNSKEEEMKEETLKEQGSREVLLIAAE